MNENNFKHRLAVYGTLKNGHGNSYLLKDSKFLGNDTISGFRMHSCGGFPVINKADEDSTIEIEVYEVTSPEVLSRIYELEGYSGQRNKAGNWYDTIDVETKHGTAEIFYFKEDMTGQRPVVENGVWR